MTLFISFLTLLYCLYLHTKLRKLEQSGVPQRLSHSSDVPKLDSASAPTSLSVHLQQAVPPSTGSPDTPAPSLESRFFSWLVTDWLLKLGAVLVLLGLGWFVSYAFAQNWIGPIGRVSLGLMVGLGIFLGGFVRSNKNEQQATVLLGLGAAVMLSTIYAAREVYDFFTPGTALTMMAAIAACIATVSVIHRVPSRALLGLVVAAIAPFLTVSATPSVTGLFLYLFVVIAATVWVVILTGWLELLVAAVGLYAMFSVMSLSSTIPSTDIPTMRVLIGSFTLLFYGVGVISALRSQRVMLTDLFIKISSALLFVMWVRELIPTDQQSWVVMVGSLLTVIGAWILFTQTSNRLLVLLHASLALIYLAIATSLQLEGPSAVISYILLTAVGVYLAGKLTGNYWLSQVFGLPFAPLAFYCLYLITTRSTRYYFDSYNAAQMMAMGKPYIEPMALWSELGLVVLLSIVLFTLGAYFYTLATSKDETPPQLETTVIYLCGALSQAVIFIWFAVERFAIAQDTAHALALCIYTLVGIGMYAYGLLQQYYKTQIVGSVLVGLVVIRLLFVEVWNMLLFQRVVVFLVIGVVLMAGAFLRPKEQKA